MTHRRAAPRPRHEGADRLAQFETAQAGRYDIAGRLDPTLRTGKDGSYAVGRARELLGWAPRPLADQVAEYLDWARRSPAAFDSRACDGMPESL
jgi:hypothetical protein